MSTARCASASAFRHLHATFLAMVPRIVAHGQVYFRHLKCPLQKEEALAEMTALVWSWHVRLTQRGKDTSQFVSALATYAARRVRSGGRLTGMERSKDVMSLLAQRVYGFAVERIPDHSVLCTSPFAEALEGNSRTAVPDQVAFRQDFPAWRLTRTERDRRIVDRLMLGDRTTEISRKFGISPGRISQLRRELYEDWCRFCADPGAAF